MTIQTTTKFPWPTSAQVYAALRYAGTAAGTVGTIAALAGIVDQQTAQNIVAAFQAVVKDLTQFLGDSSKLLFLVIPVATVWLGKIGYSSASPRSQVASVQALAPKELTAAVQAVAPKELVAATQALPTAQVTVSDPALASPGVKVAPTV
jgi:hypothetical protein